MKKPLQMLFSGVFTIATALVVGALQVYAPVISHTLYGWLGLALVVCFSLAVGLFYLALHKPQPRSHKLSKR